MTELTFNKPDYFGNYDEFREYFIASTCATLSRDFRAVKVAQEILDKHLDSILKATADKENPYLKYKFTLSPMNWKNYELIATIFFYDSSTRFGPFVKDNFLRVVAKTNNEVNNFVKSQFTASPTAIFDSQIDRVKKVLLKNGSNPRKAYTVTQEVDKLIVAMTVTNEFIGKMESLAHSMEEFELLNIIIYRQALYYQNQEHIDRDREAYTQLYLTDWNTDIHEVMKVLGLNPLAKEQPCGNMDGAYGLEYIPNTEKLKEYFTGELRDILVFEDLNLDALRGFRASIKELSTYDMVEIDTNSNYMNVIGGNNQITLGTYVSETDDLTINLEFARLCIGNQIIQAMTSKINAYQFILNCYTSIRTSTLIAHFDKEMQKQTSMEVMRVEIERENPEMVKELNEAKEWIETAKPKVESFERIQEENGQLGAKVSKLEGELEKATANQKELIALRNLLFVDSCLREEETEEVFDEVAVAIEELSKIDVFLVGGAQPWAHRVKAKLPNLQYYDADSQNRSLDKRLQKAKGVVIINTELNSHGMSYHIMPVIEKNDNLKLVYVNSHMNINRLLVHVNKQMK